MNIGRYILHAIQLGLQNFPEPVMMLNQGCTDFDPVAVIYIGYTVYVRASLNN